MVQKPAREVGLVSSSEASRGHAIAPEVVGAKGTSNGPTRGVHDGALDTRVTESIAVWPDPETAGEDVQRRSGLVRLTNDELAPPKQHRAGVGQIDRDGLVEVLRHRLFVRRL